MTLTSTGIDDTERLRVLREYPLEAAGSERLDNIARLAAQLCDAPIALVSIVEENSQSFIGRHGIDVKGTPREQSFCAYCMAGDATMEVEDARTDDRFRTNPLVLGDPNIRFYGGYPLISPEGARLGALCVIDDKPRAGLTAAQKEGLATLADLVIAILGALRTEARSRDTEMLSLHKLTKMRQRFGMLADVLPQMVWATTPDGMPDYFNRLWCEFTGSPAEASYGKGWLDVVHPDDAPNAARVWAAAIASGEPYEVRYRLRHHSEHYRWVIARGLPIRDETGVIFRWIGTCTDIEDEMATADALELLSQELSHRIKNIFAVIGGLVSLSARNHPDSSEFASELYDRILALGRAHGFVGTRGMAPASADAGLLKGMLEDMLSPYRTVDNRIVVIGDDIAIDDRSATPLALIFHELATNAAKYGAFRKADGRVVIRLEAGDPVRMLWTETGIDGSGEGKTPGFGARLIDMSVSRQLGGTYETRWSPGQLEIEISVPRANVARD